MFLTKGGVWAWLFYFIFKASPISMLAINIGPRPDSPNSTSVWEGHMGPTSKLNYTFFKLYILS